MPDNEIYETVTKEDLSRYRLEKAKTMLETAKKIVETGDFNSAANRSYYCIFHAMRAILALDGVDFKKHSGVSSYFRKEYIKAGKFDEPLSDIITAAFRERNECDYNDFYVISKSDVYEQIQNAEFFFNAITDYLVK